MTFAHILAASALLAAPAAALAADPETPVATASAKPSRSDPNRVICKTLEETGSRLAKKKVCATAAEWKERQFRAGQWNERQTTMNSPISG